MPSRAAKLHMDCPRCGEEGLRFHIEQKLVGQTVSVVCIKCQQVDVEVSFRDLCELISGITKRTASKGKVDHEWVAGFIEDHLEL